MDSVTAAAVAVAEAAVAQEDRHEDLRRTMNTPGQSDVAPGGYKVASGQWSQHATVQLAKASGVLHTAVKVYRQAKAGATEDLSERLPGVVSEAEGD